MIGTSKNIWGFDPRTIAGCRLWLDGSDSSTITLSGSSVSQWSDKSRYNLHAVASGISSSTLPTQGTMNGRNTVRFTASSSTSLKSPLILTLTNSFGGGASYFVVGQATANSPSSGGRILTSNSGGRQISLLGAPPTVLYTWSGAAPASTTASIQVSVPFVASIIEENGTMTSYVNGIANATTSATSGLISSSFFIGSFTSNGYNFDGDIGEILIYQNALTTVERQQIEAYLFWKWSVTTTAFPTALTPYVWYDASISSNLDEQSIGGVQDVITAGGGGGSSLGGNGGAGGLTGGVGQAQYGVIASSLGGGGGSSSGGAAGVDPNSSLNGTAGSQYTGGNGGPGSSSGSIAGGGGGGGFYGGGGGSGRGSYGGPGGGGSSLVSSPGFTLTSITSGGGASGSPNYDTPGGNGSVSIVYSGGSATYNYTGANQTFTVPAGVTSLTVTLNGAGGGGMGYGSGGNGARVVGTYTVSPGQVYTIIVGQGGPSAASSTGRSDTNAAFGGGGRSGVGVYSGGGGGRSAIVATLPPTQLYRWLDKSGNSRNATQGTLSNRPTFTSNVQNGLGGLLFSGSQCYNLPTLTSLNPISIFVVAKATSFSSGAMILSLTSGTGIYFRSTFGSSNPTYTSYGVDYGSGSFRYVTNTAVTDTNTHLWGFVLPASGLGTFTFDGIVCNDTVGFTTSQIGTTYSTASIGAYGQSPTNSPFTGYIFEVIIFNSALSIEQRQSIEGYLNKKWAIYPSQTSIISTNPYYRIRPHLRRFNPLDIDGLELWMDAADATTITGSNPVTQWNDKSGNSLNFTASSGPVLATASQNGLNTLTFTAANSQFMSNSSTVNFIEFYSLSIFIVFKYSNTTSAGYIFAKSLFGTANGRILFGRNAGTPATFNTGITTANNAYTTYSDSYTANTWRIYGFVVNRSAGTVNAYQNGVSISSGTFTVDTTTNLTTAYPMAIGAHNNSSGTLSPPQAGLYFDGSIGEILVYSTALTQQQRQKVEGYLSSKWGLQSVLLSGAPPTNLPITFSYTGDIQTFIVPGGVTSVTVTLRGGGGGGAPGGYSTGGAGGTVSGRLPVTPGTTYYIIVAGGGGGSSISVAGLGGYGGGGNGFSGGVNYAGAGGGGYSGIFTGSTPSQANALVIAGGGGGVAANTAGPTGAGGGTTGGTSNNPGGGGTQSAGGVGWSTGQPGSALKGGNGAESSAAGGGGGYWGGGSGYGGGGGSGFVGGLSTVSTNSQGGGGAGGNGASVSGGNGSITISSV
jgi:hypothetical protein